MKKFLSIFIIIVLVVTITGCKDNKNDNNKKEEPVKEEEKDNKSSITIELKDNEGLNIIMDNSGIVSVSSSDKSGEYVITGLEPGNVNIIFAIKDKTTNKIIREEKYGVNVDSNLKPDVRKVS